MKDHIILRLKEGLFTDLREFALSIFYYSQPFGKGGFLIVFRDEAECFIDLVSKAYCAVPPNMSLHCIRHKELFELSLPAHTTIDRIYECLHLPYWLKEHSIVIYGQDIRREIKVPTHPRLLLDAHIEVCKHLLRNHIILGLLMHKMYIRLIKELDQHSKYLISTMLLMHNESYVKADALPIRFEQLCTDNQLKHIRSNLNEIVRRIDNTRPGIPGTYKQSAIEAVWLFENFLRSLRDYAG